MSLAYGVMSVIALIMIGVCIAIDRNKKIWLLLLFISVFVCNVGYLMLSVSKTLNIALVSNRIAYLGNVFLPFFMLMMILELCRIRCRKWLSTALIAIGVIVFLLAASPGYLTVYYKTVSIETVNGITKLVREYGPLHAVYYIYLFLYFAVMLFVVGYSIAKKKIASHIHGVGLLAVVLVNIAVWFIEQLLPRGFEFLSVSHLIGEVLLLFLYGIFQNYNMRRRVICTWTIAFTCVGIALLCKFTATGNPAYFFLNMIRSLIYIGMYYAWGRVVCHGIIQKTPRRCLGTIAALLAFWLVASDLKHFVFSSNITAARYLWYAYYIPQILIGVLGLIAAVTSGKGENAKPGQWSWGLLGGAAALILLVMTNDLHQLVFSFPTGEPWTNENCAYEFGYWVIMALISLCGIAALAVVVNKCRVPGRRKYVWFPIIDAALIIAYEVLYFAEGSFVSIYLDDATAASCLMIAALLESLIESGIFQTNTGYDNLFQSSSLAAQITDYAHQTRYTSQSAWAVAPEILAQADAAPVMLDQSTRLAGAVIRGGHIYWQEDVAKLLSIQEELEAMRAELLDTGDVLKEESEQKARRLRLKEENRLYDLVETQTARQVAMLRELIAQLRHTDDLDAAKRLLSKIVTIGVYIKRRSNLIFVAGQEHSIRASELLLCMNESAENLKLYGVDCRVRISGCERLLPETANAAYDFFEAVIEACMDTASSVLLNMEPENGRLALAICADCTGDLTPLCRMFAHSAAYRDEDGLWYLSMAFEEGGGLA